MKSIQISIVLALAIAIGREGVAAETVPHSAVNATKPAEYWWHTAPTNLPAKGTAKRRVSTTTAVARPAFQWQQIESTNYVDYVKNLRSIGCPEQTLRDIVSADVIQAYGAKRNEAMAARYQDFHFWKADPEAVAELARQRRIIDEAVESNLRDLLGEDYLAPSLTADWKWAELEQQLAFLSEEKREPVEAVLLRYADTDAQIKQLSDGHRKNEDLEELQRLMADYDQKRAALANLLTPEEYELVQLTCSWTAHNLRRAMTHFNPTEAEFRGIFRIWLEQDEMLARDFAAGKADPDNKEQVFEKIRGMLSPERYAQYRATWWE